MSASVASKALNYDGLNDRFQEVDLRFTAPHPIPYQGSKRRLATAILSYVPTGLSSRLVEPFAGSAAITLAAAHQKRFSSFVIGDVLEPLVCLWQSVIESPVEMASRYEALWLRERKKPIEAYYEIRGEFNADRDPAKLLYLLARCVKNAVRFNPAGDFNQSPDKRRTGTRPSSMRAELEAAHYVLSDRTTTICADFMDTFRMARQGDFFYLDPPYQGTSEGRDQRYFGGVSRERIVEGLGILNKRRIPFVLSYDGFCGDRTYGDSLPADIASRILLDVGRSSQATLNGQNRKTIESLYISHNLQVEGRTSDLLLSLNDFESQKTMAFV